MICPFIVGVTLRLKDKKIIPNNGEVNITDLPVGGCRGYDSLECLSDVKYQGRIDVENTYWIYFDPITRIEYEIDDVRLKVRESPDIGWRSARGIYRKGISYYNVLRLGRVSEKPAVGLFTCHIEGDSNSPVSVNIINSKFKDKIIMVH